ncbi:TrmB family transcriptional regulator [Natronomonas amylolytica]|uniref:TrmB family transcriptional regulator n=1 Tax=Natronomonas amylolytica TaxID=3108498 RepID=UPI0030085E38
MTLDDLPTERKKLVYLYLREYGEATADELREALGLRLLTLLPILSDLESEAVVERRDDAYTVA